MARLIRTEKEVEGRYEEIWLVVEEDPLVQWPDGPQDVVGRADVGGQRGLRRFGAAVRHVRRRVVATPGNVDGACRSRKEVRFLPGDPT